MTTSNEIKLSETALSVFETDVAELALDPFAYGLDEDETHAYLALYYSIDWKRARLIVPEGRQARAAIASLLTDLANNYDDEVESRRAPDLAFAARARTVLTNLAWKVASSD